MPATGTATATAGKNSQAEDFVASAFNSGTAAAVNQTFQWRAEPTGNNTTTPAGTLSLLFGSGTASPSETGLKLSSKGLFTFATGQTFPDTGTITGITTATGSGLSGGGTTGTLSLKVPAAGITNAMLQNSNITLNANTAGGISTPGAMTLGSTYTLGLKPCSANQILQYSGTAWGCATLGTGTGTVTSVASGAGLTGGPITTNGTLSVATAGVTNAMLQHSSVTVTAGSGLTGGGSVALGGSTSLSLNTAVLPELATANTFTNTNTVSVNDANPALTLANASGDGLDINAGTDGVSAFSNGDGGYFNGATGGNYSENDTDSNFSVGAYGEEFGSTQKTFGLFGYSASSAGVGTYGVAVASSVTGGTISGQFGVWGDSGNYGTGVLATADDFIALTAINNSGAIQTADFENEERSANDGVVVETLGDFFGGYCLIDVSGNYVLYLLLAWLPFYLVHERHFSLTATAKIGGAAFMCKAVAALASGWLSDIWIAAGATPTLARKTLLCFGTVFSGVLLLVASLSADRTCVILLLAGSACMGLCTPQAHAAPDLYWSSRRKGLVSPGNCGLKD